jgi:hypothetical protein
MTPSHPQKDSLYQIIKTRRAESSAEISEAMVIYSSKIVGDPAANALPNPDGDPNGSPAKAYSTHSGKRSLMLTQSMTAGQSSY